MNTERFLKNIIDQIIEAHEKLGKTRETIRLYYPLESVNGYLGTSFTGIDQLSRMLNKEPFNMADRTPSHEIHENSIALLPERFHFSVSGDRLEVIILPETVGYIDQKYQASDFLKDLIHAFSAMSHELSIEKIKALFYRYSKEIITEKVPEDCGFDYMIRFKDPAVDEYCYCVKNEMGHWIYHRFMEEDYKRMIS